MESRQGKWPHPFTCGAQEQSVVPQSCGNGEHLLVLRAFLMGIHFPILIAYH